MTYDIHTAQIDPQHAAVLSGTCTTEEVGSFLGTAFERVLAALAHAAVPVDGKPFARYDMVEGGFRVEAGFPCPADLDLDGEVHSGHRPTGAPWETYLDGPEVPEPRTTVAWPCTLD
jgi:hypothetical protein